MIELGERFWSKVDKSDDCWLWTRCLDRKGYGQFRHQGRACKAHRVVFEAVHGEIPARVQIDHLCHVRHCVNPDHLRLATAGQNQRNRSGANRNSKTGERWCVQIMQNGRRRVGGYFRDLEDAKRRAAEMRAEIGLS